MERCRRLDRGSFFVDPLTGIGAANTRIYNAGKFLPAHPRARHVPPSHDNRPSASTRRRDGEGRMSLRDSCAVFVRLWRFSRLALRRKIPWWQWFGGATVSISAKNGENG